MGAFSSWDPAAWGMEDGNNLSWEFPGAFGMCGWDKLTAWSVSQGLEKEVEAMEAPGIGNKLEKSQRSGLCVTEFAKGGE